MTQSTSTVLQERYLLKARLFSEGNQAAYAAHDRERGEEVLLFLIPPGKKLSEKVDAAVRADIERAFAMEAPTLLPLLDLGDTGEFRFLIMPKPLGSNAWTRITQKTSAERLGADAARVAADDLIAAAGAAHAAGSILGFSPKQVWINARGETEVQYYWLERVHLAEGSPAAGKTGSFQTLGVEGGYFQAPELEQGASGAEPPADQFFIAAILYGLLTGEVPGGTLAPIQRSRPDVPKALARAIEKGLAPDPARRHADLDAFRRALHRRPARLGYLVPLLLLLLGLWTGVQVMAAGAGLDDWQFPAETEARRAQDFDDARPLPEPVPQADPATLALRAGRYASEAERDGLAEHELELHAGGTFAWTDRSREDVRRERGIYYAGAEPGMLVLRPVRARRAAAGEEGAGEEGAGEGGAAAVPLRVEAGRLRRGGGVEAVLRKVGWPAPGGGPFVPLLDLEQPLPGAVVADQAIRVRGRVAVRGTTVSVDGKDVTVVGTQFDTVVSKPDRGEVTVLVTAEAPDGGTGRIERVVRIDTGPPRIEATALLEEQSGVWLLAVAGRVADDGGIASLSVNDEPVTPENDGSFRYERKGADAVGFAFVEIVAVDTAGRGARRLLWPAVKSVGADDLAAGFAAFEAALAAGKTGDAEDRLRDVRTAGGLIEQLPPEKLARLVHSERAPRISVDDHPHPPAAWFSNDGSQEITLSGRVDWFVKPGDTLMVAGRTVDVEDGRFEVRFPLPKLGPNKVAVRVLRDGETAAERDLDVWITGEDGKLPTWTGVPVTAAQRGASARHGLPLGIVDAHGQRFVLVPDGAFERETRSGRRFEVRVTQPYYLQIEEVSRELYERTTGLKLPTVWKARGGNLPVGGLDRPATGMTRGEALTFAQRLGGPDGDAYDLPTEAQWELAARAGDATGDTYWGSRASDVPAWANFADKAIRNVLPLWPANLLTLEMDDGAAGTWAVTQGRANAFGLRNMLGNAAEWTRDFLAEYDPQAPEDPTGPASGRQGVVRGGSFHDLFGTAGFGVRRGAAVDQGEAETGLRLVLRPGRR